MYGQNIKFRTFIVGELTLKCRVDAVHYGPEQTFEHNMHTNTDIF